MEQNQPRASIIIIAYNAEKTVERAIQSACNQTESNIEIICVDDGSTDPTYERMCQYAEPDERIKPVTQANGGTLGARYSGLQQVTSDYVLFLDADDTLMPEAVETACNAAEEIGADVLEFGVEMVKNSESPPSEVYWDWLELYFSQVKPLPETACGSELINACFDGAVFPHNVWNKLYCTDVLRAALQEYRGERVGFWEDMLITLMVLCHTKQYARIYTKLYRYTVGGGMTTSTACRLSSDDLNSNGIEWQALKLAREWLGKIAYPQNEITPAMDAIARNIQDSVYESLTERYAPDTRSGILHDGDFLYEIFWENEHAVTSSLHEENYNGCY